MTEHTTNITIGSPNQDYDNAKWQITREHGNYYVEFRVVEDALEQFTKACKLFGATFQLDSSSHGAGYGPSVYIQLQNDIISVNFHEKHTLLAVQFFDQTVQKKPQSYVSWFFSDPQRGINQQQMKLEGHDPKNEFYPQMPKPIAEFAKDFANSDANVLLLLGQPGTGKTSFIRGIIRTMEFETWVSYDPVVQESEQFYISFASIGANMPSTVAGGLATTQAEYNEKFKFAAQSAENTYWKRWKQTNDDISNRQGRVLVLEDADSMLGKRTDGNKLMNRMLNLADGLVSIPKRKLIITTNLPGLKDVDEALLRPGRCFGVVQFRQLTRAEADKACASIGRECKSNKDKMTLSEALNGHLEHSMAVQRIGF